MRDYYSKQLNAGRLLSVYQTNIPRVAQYLNAEMDYIRKFLHKDHNVMELGAGYGRVLKELAPYVKRIGGIDIAEGSVTFGQNYLKDVPNASLYMADALSFETEQKYDVVICIQNGLSAIKGNPYHLVQKALALLRAGGKALFSTYSGKFWAYRLAWFQEQADKGLLGELDFEKSVNGQIVCKDGFTATAFTEEELKNLGASAQKPFYIEEADCSSIFLRIDNI